MNNRVMLCILLLYIMIWLVYFYIRSVEKTLLSVERETKRCFDKTDENYDYFETEIQLLKLETFLNTKSISGILKNKDIVKKPADSYAVKQTSKKKADTKESILDKSSTVKKKVIKK